MKKIYRIISLVLVMSLLMPSAFVLSADAAGEVCPICHRNCGWDTREVPATCKNPKQIIYYCYIKDEEKAVSVDDRLDPENHESPEDIELVTEKSVEPTCTESGCEVYRYNDCGAEVSFEIAPLHPNGHDYIAKPVKCSDTITNYRCERCGEEKQEPRTPSAHSYKAEPFSCYDECIDYYCTVCNAYKQEARTPSEHKWTDWSMIKEHTASADGQKTRTCTVCGKSETETVPAGTVSRFVEDIAYGDITVQYKSAVVIEPEIIAAAGAKLKVEFSSSAPGIADIDNNGNLSAHKTGSAKITVTVTDTDGIPTRSTFNVTVKYAWWQWIINILLLGFLWY